MYGGSLHNRMRFLVEIVRSIKKYCGNNYPISIKLSIDDCEPNGIRVEETVEVAKVLEKEGVSMLNLMMGTHAVVYPSTGFYDINIYLSQAKQIKDAVQIPCMVGLGVQTASLAESILESGQGDFIALAKQEIADCNWPNKVKNNQEDDIRPCISCHFGCLARIFQVDMKTMSSKDISCALNPRCGMENHYNITKADVIKKVAVVGGGIAGMEAARVAALRGHSVDLYEKTDRLGGVFNEASAFDFKDDDRRLLAWYKKQIKDAGVNVKFNTEFKVEDKANYDVVFVATGASEKRLDNIPGFDQPNVRYAVDVLDKQDIKDQNVVIIGGGLTGCELAYDLARKNKKVSVVEALPTIMNVEGLAAPNYNMLVELMEYYHVDLYKNATVKEYKDGKLMIDVMTTNEPNINNRARMMSLFGVHHTPKAIEADTVVVSVGYKSNQTLYDSIKGENVYLLGDAIQPGNLMTAIWGAYTTALKI